MGLNARLSKGDARLYSADRDIAYCGVHMFSRAISGLDEDKQEPWVKSFLAEHYITNNDLGSAARCFAQYINKVMFDPQYKEPIDALTAAGFFDLAEPIRIIICAKIGQVFLSTYFVGVRDVTADANDPPVDSSIITQAADKLLKALACQKGSESASPEAQTA